MAGRGWDDERKEKITNYNSSPLINYTKNKIKRKIGSKFDD